MAGVALDLRVLGSVEARAGDAVVDAGPRRQRCVLVALVADANRVVPADRLVERAWGDDAPASARATVRTYVSRLRKVLAGPGTGVTIDRRAGGYVLTVDPDAVDLHRFHRLVARADATPGDAARPWLADALAAWSGEAFAGLDTPWINALRESAHAARDAVALRLIDVRLRAGEHDALVTELAAMAAARPLDERIAAQLMVALGRSGRQADALRHFERVRAALATTLGVDPSAALAAVRQRILTGDEAPTTGPTPAPAAREPGEPAPCGLPPSVGVLSGRARELAALDAEPAPRVVAITGPGGVGKTSLAVQWAWQALDRFPDGQLFVDLRGFAPDEPVPVGAAARALLGALRVDVRRLPPGEDALLGRYREVTARKRLLVVLDNARDSDHASALLPGGSGCVVVVTSRDRLAGLVAGHGARAVPVPTLTDEAGRDALAARLGAGRVAAEPGAVDELVAACGGLPLALAVLAGRAATRPELPLATWVEPLRDAATRLDTLDTGDGSADVAGALSWSTAALTPAEARASSLLAVAGGPDVTAPVAAAVLGVPTSDARAVLGALQRVSLLAEHAPGRWRQHDLVRLHGMRHADRVLGPGERAAAVDRLLAHQVAAAVAADRLLDPHRPPIEARAAGPRPDRAAVAVLPDGTAVPDEAGAVAWFSAELPGLLGAQRLAADHGRRRAVWELAWAVTTFTFRQGRLDEALLAWRRGLDAARADDDVDAQILASRQLGRACLEQGAHADALAHLEHALALTRATGARLDSSYVLLTLARAWQVRDDPRRALAAATEALRVLDDVPDASPVWHARVLNAVGWYEAHVGDHAAAARHCEAALALYRAHDDRHAQADTLDSLGYIAHHAGRPDDAVAWYRAALPLHAATGAALAEADTLDRLADSLTALGRTADADDAWRAAALLYERGSRDADAARVRARLSQR